jgi:2-polyprenyl-6-methoxyphenol hydroxylase-like FAD-dependent oxidoreductase
MSTGSDTQCAVVGGGPAGIMLGLLLARAGVEVTVLEKHADFLRDFRGDTVHPVTLRMLDQLGIGDRFNELPHSVVDHAEFALHGHQVTVVDFRRLHQPHPYIAMVPQWDLLNLLAETAAKEKGFTLLMESEVTGLLTDGDAVTGVRYTGPTGERELRADLTVACDGRWSIVRREAGMTVREFPVPFDIWWFRLPRSGEAQYSLVPHTAPGRGLIMIPREGYYQIAYMIPKGGDAALRARGIEALKAELAQMIPDTPVDAIESWDQIKFLDVRLDRLRRWYREGLLCIGDAAHAMSPVGGVGINLAIADAVGTARLLADPLRTGAATRHHLAAVQRRRQLPTTVTQGLQRFLHRELLGPVLRGEEYSPPAFMLQLLEKVPALTAVPAYVIGVGLHAEEIPAFARR